MSLQDLLDVVPRGSEELSLLHAIDFRRLPRHVAIIMDGNGRWAKLRHKRRVEGHRAGIASVRDVVETSARLGIEVLTLYAFSVENWKRPRTEVGTLMSLLKRYLRMELDTLLRNRGQRATAPAIAATLGLPASQFDAGANSVLLNLNLDSVGGASGLTALTSGFERLDAWIRETAAQAGLPVTTHLPLMANSDHANFAAHGIPAARLIAGFGVADSNLRLLLTAADTHDLPERPQIRLAAVGGQRVG